MALWRPDISAESEPMRVLIKRGEFVDPARDGRAIPYKIYYPDAVADGAAAGFAAPYPLIIWSHGLGGTRDGASFIARYVAAHGYILAHIQHDGTDDSLWRNENGHPWDAIRRKMPVPWEVVKNRYLDVHVALDSLTEMLGNDPAIAPIIDMAQIGMSGHSFGALTTQVMAGQAVGKGANPEFFTDPRFKAGILYSPVPNFRLDIPVEDIYGPIGIPLLHMTGTNDESPVEGFGHDKRIEVWNHANGPEQHLITIAGADHMVFNGSRGQLLDYATIDEDKDVIKIMSLAWWDAFLKDDAAAMAWIKSGGPQNWLGEKAEYLYKNG